MDKTVIESAVRILLKIRNVSDVARRLSVRAMIARDLQLLRAA
jgi:hypothetical protein